MTEWPLGSGQFWEEGGAATASSDGTQIAGAGSVNAKGSWVELIAATEHDTAGVLLTIVRTEAINRNFRIDLGVGAAASEQVIVPDIYIWNGAADHRSRTVFVPIAIPAGSRVSGRVQCSSSFNDSAWVTVSLVSAGFGHPAPYHRMAALGAGSASDGTDIDPGGTANTKGSWVEFASSTEFDARQLLLIVGENINTSMADATWLMDIGVGAAASEQVIIPNMPFAADLASDYVGNPVIGPLPVSIPAGSRIALRSQCSITDSLDRVLDAVVYIIG